MKKTILSVALLLGGYATKAQTEYIDIAKVGMLGTSTMAIYNDDKDFDDLQVYKLNVFDKKDIYHYVKYTNLYDDKVVLTLSDDQGDTRKICIKEDGVLQDCYTVDSFATVYEFTTDAHTFTIYVSRTNNK